MQSAHTSVHEARHAVTDHPIHPLLEARWSPRAFAGRAVEADKLRALLEAARWAPSSANGQPWHFLLGVQGSPTHERLAGVLRESNRTWAARAPVLLLAVARSTTLSGQPSAHAFYDVGLAVANLTVQATALDLYVHQMAGFFPDRARAEFAIPEEYSPVTVLAIGYLGDPEQLDAQQQERERAPRQRRLLAEFVFEGSWGQPAQLVQPSEER
jgi:nitroreductase